MNARRTVAGVVGVAAVAAVVALVVGAVGRDRLSPLSAVVDGVDGGQYLLALAAVALLGGLWFARRRGSSPDDRFRKLRETPPEGVAAPASIRVGGRFDRLVGEAVASGDEGAMRPVASRLRETAVGLYADATDEDPETARSRVRDGAWTDDELAAAFLAESGAMPFRSRIRAWLDPARERRRRVDAALDALFELREGVVPDADPATPSDPADPAERTARSESTPSDDDPGAVDSGEDDAPDEGDAGESWVAGVGGRGER